MRKLIVLPVVGIAAAVTAVAVGAGGAGTAPSVTGFVSLAATGIHEDFDPLTSPRDAVDKGDLIVEGTVVDVADGIALHYPDPAYTERTADTYATLVIDVTKVIDGDAGRLSDGRAYVALAKSPVVTTAQLSEANVRPRIVAVLDDITTWAPEPGVTVARPASVPTGAPLHAPYADGMWLQAAGDGEMHSIGVHREELAPAWGEPRDLGQFSTALQRATRR